MAMSSEPGCERLDPDSAIQTNSLTDIMAAMMTKDSDGSAANGVKNGKAQREETQAKRTQLSRPHLTGRKLSLQERGTYVSSGSGAGYTHTSPRVARRPTVESKRVSISDSQVRLSVCNSSVIVNVYLNNERFSFTAEALTMLYKQNRKACSYS